MGEIALKGGNRRYFEDRLIKQIIRAIKDIGYEKIYKEQGKIYIEAEDFKFPEMINILKKVFGLVYISPCIRVNKDVNQIEKATLDIMKDKIEKDKFKSFKVMVNRADKNFPIKSPEMCRNIGGLILENFQELKVDVHKPDEYLYIDIKENAYIYIDRYEGTGGMPTATGGRGLLLLSGGIDSPVAGYLMAKRGIEISALHFHSYPFTSERAEEKVKGLASILARYTGSIKMYSVNILNIQKEINEKCNKSEMTILSRRFMMRIGEAISRKHKIDALITGESLGQVASQTIQGITAINDSVDLPILRPLISHDKVDIIKIARDIETYETSILPFEDSCTVFLPKRPVIKPRIKDIKKSEENLDVDFLINDAIENMEIYTIE